MNINLLTGENVLSWETFYYVASIAGYLDKRLKKRVTLSDINLFFI